MAKAASVAGPPSSDAGFVQALARGGGVQDRVAVSGVYPCGIRIKCEDASGLTGTRAERDVLEAPSDHFAFEHLNAVGGTCQHGSNKLVAQSLVLVELVLEQSCKDLRSLRDPDENEIATVVVSTHVELKRLDDVIVGFFGKNSVSPQAYLCSELEMRYI